MDAARHFKIVGWLWLAFGALGFLYTSWHAIMMGHFIYSVGGLGAFASELFGCVSTFAATVAGFGLLRHWSWSRVVIELLGSMVLTFSVITLLFSEIVMSQRIALFVPVSLFALYSLVITLFLRYEARAA